MKILFAGSCLFILSCLIHVIIWKIRLPKGQTKTLAKIFALVLTAGIIFFAVDTGRGFSWLDIVHISIFYAVLALVYLNTYSAIEVDSPTLVIVSLIHNAQKKGLLKIELENALSDDVLIAPRVKDLEDARLVSFDGVRYKLTPTGLRFVSIFIFWRKLLNAGLGG